jgi:ketosteroid isomerase-like protein
VTIGTWTYRQDTLADHGYYLTAWRRNVDGGWAVAIDHGIDGPAGAVAADQGALPLGAATSDAGSRSCPSGGDAKGLADADARFNDAIRRKGFDASLRRVLAPGGFVMRDGHLPAPPTADWPLDDATLRAPIEAVTRGAYAAPGSDLGYTYGELASRGERKAPRAARAVFLRVWVRDGRQWQVLADMTTPLPRE